MRFDPNYILFYKCCNEIYKHSVYEKSLVSIRPHGDDKFQIGKKMSTQNYIHKSVWFKMHQHDPTQGSGYDM